MATSESVGEIRTSAIELGADRFVDTMLARDLVDSALHKCDEAGQARIAWVAPSSTVWPAGGATPYEAIYGDQADGDLLLGTEGAPWWYSFGLGFRYAPKVRFDGRGYRLRIRIAGACSSAGTVDFIVVVMAGAVYGAGYYYAGGDPGDGTDGSTVGVRRYSGITSTTPAWLTPDGGGADYISLPATMIEEGYRTNPSYPTRLDIGGAPTTLIIPTIKILVLGSSRTEGVRPQLHGFYAAETVGDS